MCVCVCVCVCVEQNHNESERERETWLNLIMNLSNGNDEIQFIFFRSYILIELNLVSFKFVVDFDVDTVLFQSFWMEMMKSYFFPLYVCH